MERLTEEKQLGPWASLKDHAEAIPGAFANYDCLMAHMTAVTRLKAYEDTGLTPEEIDMDHEAAEELRRLCRNYDLGRLEALAEADKDGRVVVLPCKVGDTVYWLHGAAITACRVHRIQQNRNGLYICTKSTVSHGDYRVDLCLGKTVFLTREEAEKALEAMQDG